MQSTRVASACSDLAGVDSTFREMLTLAVVWSEGCSPLTILSFSSFLLQGSSISYTKQVFETMRGLALQKMAQREHMLLQETYILRQSLRMHRPVDYPKMLRLYCSSVGKPIARKSFYSMGGILIITWAAKRAIGCRNVFAPCHNIALSALLAVPGYLRTHPILVKILQNPPI